MFSRSLKECVVEVEIGLNYPSKTDILRENWEKQKSLLLNFHLSFLFISNADAFSTTFSSDEFYS
jgi:hypothetical protein